MPVKMSKLVFWVVMPRERVGRYQRFRKAVLKMEVVYSSETLVSTYKLTVSYYPEDEHEIARFVEEYVIRYELHDFPSNIFYYVTFVFYHNQTEDSGPDGGTHETSTNSLKQSLSFHCLTS
jgi:hypothetical protein